MIDAQVTFCRFQDRQLSFIDLLPKLLIENFDHANVIVGATLRACATTNARIVIDLHHAG